jgi:hypothetical protein
VLVDQLLDDHVKVTTTVPRVNTMLGSGEASSKTVSSVSQPSKGLLPPAVDAKRS